MAPITLGYWKIRGLAQPARTMLGYNKVDFTDELYECGAAPDYDRSCWNDVKQTLGLQFPNLPYLIDGDIKITQSNAVMSYLGRKFHMDGDTEQEKVRVDMIANQAMDFRNGFVGLVYRSNPGNFEAKSDDYKKQIPTLLGLFDKFLGVNDKWFAGGKLTYVDFIMYELLDQHRLFDEKILAAFDNLNKFMRNFEELPEIKEFVASEKYFKGPINNPSALFK